MNTFLKLTTVPLVLLSTVFLAANSLGQSSWNSTVFTGNTTTAANWDPSGEPAAGTVLTFNGTTGQSYAVDNTIAAGTSFNGITLGGPNGRGNFTITGNGILLPGPLTVADPGGSSTHILNIDLNLGGAVRTFAINGSETVLHLGGVLSNGAIGGTTGNGTLYLDGINNSFNTGTVSLYLESGTTYGKLIADAGSNSSFGSGGMIQIGNANTSGILALEGSAAAMSTNRTIRIGGITAGSGNATISNQNSNAAHTVTFTSGNFNDTRNVASSRSLTLTGINTGNNTVEGIIRNHTTNVSHSLSLIKSGDGKWILGGNNTYTGTTTVSAGTLIINGNSSAANGAVNVAIGATLGGNGTVGGATTIAGNLKPGNSPGLLTFSSSLTLNSTSTTTMEIDGDGTRGTDYDAINVGTSLVYGGNLTLDIGTTFGAGSYAFNLFDFTTPSGSFATGGVTLAGSYSGILVNDGFGVWELTSGDETWTFTQSNGVLGLSVIPEPGTVVLLGIGSAFMLWNLRRRRGG